MLTDDALQGLRDRLADRLIHPITPTSTPRARRSTPRSTSVQPPSPVARDERGGRRRRPGRSSGRSAIAVRGGGHAVAGHSVADGALVVDLRRMRGVTVDPVARRARAGGGAVWEDVDRATIPHDLGVDRRDVLGHRHRRLDARGRAGLPHGLVRPHLRQPHAGHARHRGRVDRRGRARRRSGAALGAARRRRQLRRRDGVRVPARRAGTTLVRTLRGGPRRGGDGPRGDRPSMPLPHPTRS